MKNCLVTKLKDVVLNDDLLMINELRISFKEKPYYGNSNVDGKLALKLSIATPIKLKIIRGKAIFTDINGSQMISSNEVELTQIGYNTIHLEANSDFIISISNKNAINGFGDHYSFVTNVDRNSIPKYVSSIQLDDLKYLNQNLFCINLNDTFIKGDISSLYQYEELNMLGLKPPKYTNTSFINNVDNELSEVYGDINRFLLKGMTYLNVARTKLYGDIANLNMSNYNKAYSYPLSIYNSKIYGNISDLNLNPDISFEISASDNVAEDTAEKCGYNIYGDVCKTFSYTSKNGNDTLYLKGLSSMFGNIDILHRDIYFMTNKKGRSLFHYIKDVSNPRQYILALESVNLGEYLDDYLIDMSNLKIHPKAGPGAWLRTIDVYGEKTSKSDEAVKNLQEKGISVIIHK